MNFDINFNFQTDANGGDPDLTSPTLKKYHKILWSKLLPDGKNFVLNKKSGAYLHHSSEIGEFYLGSDAITNSYKHHKSKKWLTEQIADEVQELFNAGSTIGAYIIYPNKKNGGHTINQARGVNRFIDDRFDLTLECIRLFYENKNSPLFDTFTRYKSFFDIFSNFKNYVDFFLLQDLVDKNYNVIFFLPFDNFQTKPIISTKENYLKYKNNAVNFIFARNKRIENYVNENIEEIKRLHIT